jgi:DNA-binding NarL/FixJ family response regulator
LWARALGLNVNAKEGEGLRRIKVLVADDHRLMLESIRLALEADGGIEIVAEVESGAKVIPFVGQTGPDLVLLDVRLPGVDGLTVLERIRERYPHVRVVMISGIDDPAVIQAAFDRGASAFIVKRIDPRDLPSALRQAISRTVFQPLRSRERPRPETNTNDADLTKRELTILYALQRGETNKEIAKELCLAEQTVKFHLTNLYRKLEVASRTEAVRYAYEHGIAERPRIASISP